MMRLCGALLALAATATAGLAHFVWIEPELKADPAATKLFAEARAARAGWENFPGFSADLEANVEGKVFKGKVGVGAKGAVTVTLDGADDEVKMWARRTLSSIVSHRLDSGASSTPHCAFEDDNADHPLGRAVKVLGDEFHSSYRIRDRQIIVVNRTMGDYRFTITVLENKLTEEKRFLSSVFVVNNWDLKTDALRSSETCRQTWVRVGAFDLPEGVLTLTAEKGRQEARRLTLSNHRLTTK
jgi:hypothetical protein